MHAQWDVMKTEPAAGAAGPAAMPAKPGLAAENSSGAAPGLSVWPSPADLAVMRCLVAQLADSQPPASQHGERSPQPLQQAASSQAAGWAAALFAPPAVQQPGVPEDPHPTRTHSLTLRPPQAAGHEQAWRAHTPRVGSAQADAQQSPVVPATGKLPAPTGMQGAPAMAAPAAPVMEPLAAAPPCAYRPGSCGGSKQSGQSPCGSPGRWCPRPGARPRGRRPAGQIAAQHDANPVHPDKCAPTTPGPPWLGSNSAAEPISRGRVQWTVTAYRSSANGAERGGSVAQHTDSSCRGRGTG